MDGSLAASGAQINKHAVLQATGGSSPPLVPLGAAGGAAAWDTFLPGQPSNSYAASTIAAPFTGSGASLQMGPANLAQLGAASRTADAAFAVQLSGLPPGGPVALQKYSITLTVAARGSSGGATTSTPLTTLSPILGAGAHLSLIRQDFSYMLHAHAEPAAATGTAAVAASHAAAAPPPPKGGGGGSSSTTMPGMPGMRKRLLRERRALLQMSGAGMAAMAPMPGAFGPNVTATLSFPFEGNYLLVAQFMVANATLLLPAFALRAN